MNLLLIQDVHYTDDEIAIFKTVIERGAEYFLMLLKKEEYNV